MTDFNKNFERVTNDFDKSFKRAEKTTYIMWAVGSTLTLAFIGFAVFLSISILRFFGIM